MTVLEGTVTVLRTLRRPSVTLVQCLGSNLLPWPGQRVCMARARALLPTCDLAVHIREPKALSWFLTPKARPAFPRTRWVQCLGMVNLIPNGATPASPVTIAAGEVQVFKSIRCNLTTLLNGVWSLATVTPVPIPLTLVPRAVSLAPIRLQVLPSIVLCRSKVPRWNMWLLVSGTRVLRCPNRVRNRSLPIPVSNRFPDMKSFLANLTSATPLEALNERLILLLGTSPLSMNNRLASRRGPTTPVPIPSVPPPLIGDPPLVVVSLPPLLGANARTFKVASFVFIKMTTFYPTCPLTRPPELGQPTTR